MFIAHLKFELPQRTYMYFRRKLFQCVSYIEAVLVALNSKSMHAEIKCDAQTSVEGDQGDKTKLLSNENDQDEFRTLELICALFTRSETKPFTKYVQYLDESAKRCLSEKEPKGKPKSTQDGCDVGSQRRNTFGEDSKKTNADPEELCFAAQDKEELSEKSKPTPGGKDGGSQRHEESGGDSTDANADLEEQGTHSTDLFSTGSNNEASQVFEFLRFCLKRGSSRRYQAELHLDLGLKYPRRVDDFEVLDLKVFPFEDYSPYTRPHHHDVTTAPFPTTGVHLLATVKARMHYEVFRLGTFLDMHVDHPCCLRLANAGFFYTFQDRMVQCYSCGLRWDDWQPEQDFYAEHKRRRSECLHVQGKDTSNVPIHEDQSRFRGGADITGENIDKSSSVRDILGTSTANLQRAFQEMGAIRHKMEHSANLTLTETPPIANSCSTAASDNWNKNAAEAHNFARLPRTTSSQGRPGQSNTEEILHSNGSIITVSDGEKEQSRSSERQIHDGGAPLSVAANLQHGDCFSSKPRTPLPQGETVTTYSLPILNSNSRDSSNNDDDNPDDNNDIITNSNAGGAANERRSSLMTQTFLQAPLPDGIQAEAVSERVTVQHRQEKTSGNDRALLPHCSPDTSVQARPPETPSTQEQRSRSTDGQIYPAGPPVLIPEVKSVVLNFFQHARNSRRELVASTACQTSGIGRLEEHQLPGQIPGTSMDTTTSANEGSNEFNIRQREEQNSNAQSSGVPNGITSADVRGHRFNVRQQDRPQTSNPQAPLLPRVEAEASRSSITPGWTPDYSGEISGYQALPSAHNSSFSQNTNQTTSDRPEVLVYYPAESNRPSQSSVSDRPSSQVQASPASGYDASRALYPNYRERPKRLESFVQWPHLLQDPEDLVDAEFFFADTGDEGGMRHKRRDRPDSEEDPDDFVVQSNHHCLRLHISSKLPMESFATSTPEDVILEEPDARVELTPFTDNEGATKMFGEQKPYASLHGHKMCAFESIDRTRKDQDLSQPMQPFPTDSTGRSDDVLNCDENAPIGLHKKAAASSDLDWIQDKRIPVLAANLPIPVPFLAITAQPVMPQSTQEGLARVDFRSPDRERMRVEGFRVGTFLLYPLAEDQAVLRLANAGFYYTGRGDTLACFCCDVTFTYAERRPGEDPYDIHRQLNPDCPYLTGEETRNIFIQDDQTHVATSRDITGSASQPAKAAQLVPEARQNLRQGFSQYYSSTLTATGNKQNQDGSTVGHPSNTQEPDQSTRYNNNINETNLADAATATAHTVRGNDTIGISNLYNRREINREHRRPEAANQEISPQFPPRTAADTERSSAGNNDPSVSEGLQGLTAPPDTGYNPAQAVHPRYIDLRQREDSYSQWPDTHAQSPEELAVAGFFFTGIGDIVRCHYCGLGLKHWDPDDRPLDEHVRWRSSCGYLLALCGEDFVSRTLARLGGGQRGNAFRGNNNRAGRRAVTPRNLVQATLNIQEGNRNGQVTNDNDVNDADNSEDITEIVTGDNGDDSNDASDDAEGRDVTVAAAVSDAENSALGRADNIVTNDPSMMENEQNRLQEENARLQERVRCKVCLDSMVCALFLPCWHMVCCLLCAAQLTHCPICRKKIMGVLRRQHN